MKKITLTGLFLCLFLAFTSIAGAQGEGPAGLDRPADSNATENEEKGKRLLTAAEDGILEEVRRLVSSGVNPNTKDEQGETPLTLASLHGREEVVEYLLEKGADPNLGNDEGRTPLMAASILLSTESLIEILLKHGADLHAQDKGGRTAMYWALLYVNYSMVNFLGSKGAKMSPADKILDVTNYSTRNENERSDNTTNPQTVKKGKRSCRDLFEGLFSGKFPFK